MKILVIVNFNLVLDFWLYLEIPFLVKTKVKLGQMKWWTKLTNNIVINSLYNIQNKQSLPSNKNYLVQLVLQLLGFRLVI